MIGAVPDPLLASLYRFDSQFRLSSHLPFESLARLRSAALIHQLPAQATSTDGGKLVSGFMGTAWTGTAVASRVYYALNAEASSAQFSFSMWCYIDNTIADESTPRLLTIGSTTATALELFLQHTQTGWTVVLETAWLPAGSLFSKPIPKNEWFHVVLSVSLSGAMTRLWVDAVSGGTFALTSVDLSNLGTSPMLSLGNSISSSQPFTCTTKPNALCFNLFFYV